MRTRIDVGFVPFPRRGDPLHASSAYHCQHTHTSQVDQGICGCADTSHVDQGICRCDHCQRTHTSQVDEGICGCWPCALITVQPCALRIINLTYHTFKTRQRMIKCRHNTGWISLLQGTQCFECALQTPLLPPPSSYVPTQPNDPPPPFSCHTPTSSPFHFSPLFFECPLSCAGLHACTQKQTRTAMTLSEGTLSFTGTVVCPSDIGLRPFSDCSNQERRRSESCGGEPSLGTTREITPQIVRSAFSDHSGRTKRTVREAPKNSRTVCVRISTITIFCKEAFLGDSSNEFAENARCTEGSENDHIPYAA